MRRFARSTRGRLVLTQVVVLAVALLLSDVAVYFLLSTAELNTTDEVLRSQAASISSGLENANGTVTFGGGDLPTETQEGIAIDAAIVLPNGSVTQTPGQPLPTDRLTSLATTARTGTVTPFTFIDSHGTPRRATAEALNVGTGPPAVLVVSRSIKETQTILRWTAIFLAALSLVVLVLGAFLAHRLAGRVLQPVRRIASMARSISQEDLHKRVDIPVPDDELGELAETFNGMLARLEAGFVSLRSFTADASHELRSPLALMKTEIEGTMSRPRTAEEYRRAMTLLADEVESMSRVTDRLLYLARADAGELQLRVGEVDVADTLLAAAGRWQKAARGRDVTIEVTAPESGAVAADEDLLRRVLDNLLDNALRHSPAGAPVELGATRVDGHWRIDVRDHGPGVPVALADRVFERFGRVDDARGRESGGAGLGLALSRVIAEAHGGTLTLVPGNGGARFRLELPADPKL
jgi:heavy metal sensor kinase